MNALEYGWDLSTIQKHQLDELHELDEICFVALKHINLVQQQRAKWHEQLIKTNLFQPRDLTLLYDFEFEDFKGKLCT